jgi:hypothetical protein
MIPRLLDSSVLAVAVLFAVWTATALPFLLSGSAWGIWDWDHHFAFAEVERQALLNGVLPLWNPYIAGGTPLLQHPLASSLCPDFLLTILPLGVPIGMKVLVALRLAIGLSGGFLLGRTLGFAEAVAAYFSVLINASGAYAAHLLYGHAEWSLLGYVPWTVLALLRFADGARWTWGSVAASGVALLYLGGGVYLLFGLAFFWGALMAVEAVSRRDIRWIARAALPFALAGGLASAKLLPSWELFHEHPRRAVAMRGLFGTQPTRGWREIPRASAYVFVSRDVVQPADPEVLRHRPRKDYSPMQRRARAPIGNFVNFRAYLGIVPLLLVPLAFAGPVRWRAGFTAGTALLTVLALSDSLGRSFGFNPWQELRALPVLGTLRTAGRFLAVAVLGVSALSALGLQVLLRRGLRGRPLLAVAVGLAVILGTAADQGVRNARGLSLAFRYPPQPVERAPAFVTELLPHRGFDYATVRAGVGARTGHTNLLLQTGAVANDNRSYRGEVYLQRNGEAELVAIRPNEVEVLVRAGAADALVVNQTFSSGWRRTDRPAEVFSDDGRVATPVLPEDRRVRLEYRPRLLGAGLGLSLASFLGVATLLARDLRRHRK